MNEKDLVKFHEWYDEIYGINVDNRKSNPYSFLITNEDYKKLTELSKIHNVSRAEVVRQLIKKEWEKQWPKKNWIC